MGNQGVREIRERRREIGRRAFLASVVSTGAAASALYLMRHWPLWFFSQKGVRPLVVVHQGSIADGTKAVVGECIQWRGEEVVGICSCVAYELPNRGLLFKVDGQVPQVPASQYYPKPGLRIIEWVLVGEDGEELEHPILSFAARFV